MRLLAIHTMTFILLCGSTLWAQDGAPDTNVKQLYVFYGKVLPNGVDGIDEIFALWGAKYAQSMNSSRDVLWELGAVTNADDQTKWMGASGSLRLDIPIETYIANAYIGVDFTRYSAGTSETKNYGGVHAGGGLAAHIGGNCHFRFDMKLNSKPGTSLLFNLGFSFDL